MDKNLADHTADMLRAISHPIRLRIVEVLEAGPMSVGQIAEALGERQAVTSQQLSIMKDKDILSSRREGARVFYRIENKDAVRVLRCVHDHCRRSKAR